MKNRITAGSFIFILCVLSNSLFSQTHTFFRTYNPGHGRKILTLVNGEFIIMADGRSGTFSEDASLFLAKFNSDGDTIWTKTYAKPNSLIIGNDIIESGNNGYLLTGSFYNGRDGGSPTNIFYAELDSRGDTLKWKNFDYNYTDKAYTISDNVLSETIIGGVSGTNGLILRLNNGSLQSKKEYGFGSGGGLTEILSIIKNEAGDLFLFGNYAKINPASDKRYKSFLLKTNNQGDSLWYQELGEEAWNLYFPQAILTKDNNLVISVFVYTPTKEYTYIVKLSPEGEIIWEKKYGLTLRTLTESNDGSFIIIANGNRSDTFNLCKLSQAGDSLWTKRIYFAQTNSIFFGDAEINNGFLVLTGSINKYDDLQRIYLAKMDPEGTLIGVNGKSYSIPQEITLNQNYPNPFNPSTTIEYSLPVQGNVNIFIYDMLGNKVTTLLSEYKQAGNYKVSWEGKNYSGEEVSSGVYFYLINFHGNILSRKMVLIR